MPLFFSTLLAIASMPFPALADPISATVAAISAAAPTLSTIGTIASVGGSLVSGLGAMQQGRAANANAKFQARQLDQQAGQTRASAQRVAIEEKRKAAIATSNLRAAAGKSGAGVSDPTVLNLEGGIQQQGDYNALSALFSGEEKAAGMELQGKATRAEGKQARRAGYMSGVSTIVGGVGNTLIDKYGSSKSSTQVIDPVFPWQQQGMKRPDYMGGGYY